MFFGLLIDTATSLDDHKVADDLLVEMVSWLHDILPMVHVCSSDICNEHLHVIYLDSILQQPYPTYQSRQTDCRCTQSPHCGPCQPPHNAF